MACSQILADNASALAGASKRNLGMQGNGHWPVPAIRVFMGVCTADGMDVCCQVLERAEW
eukprot:2547114-Pleurochrysis_carterae.AAC.1